MEIPIICYNCGTIFTLKGFGFEGEGTFTSVGNSVGPCPKCGGMGTVPNGVYQIKNDFLQIAKVDEGKDLDVLFAILNKFNALEKFSIQELEKEIEKEVPQYKGFIEMLKKFIMNNSLSMESAIAIIVMLIPMIYQIHHDITDKTEERIVEVATEQKRTNELLETVVKQNQQLINTNKVTQKDTAVKEKQRSTKKKKVYKKRPPKKHHKNKK